YEAWRTDPLTEHKMNSAMAALNNIAAYAFNYWHTSASATVYHANNEGEYRTQLANRECKDFAVLRDIAEGHKHVTLDRRFRQVTNADQIAMQYAGGAFSAAFSADFDIGGDQFVVTLDDGTKRRVRDIAENVLRMWEQLLTRYGM